MKAGPRSEKSQARTPPLKKARTTTFSEIQPRAGPFSCRLWAPKRFAALGERLERGQGTGADRHRLGRRAGVADPDELGPVLGALGEPSPQQTPSPQPQRASTARSGWDPASPGTPEEPPVAAGEIALWAE
jgi:hypothetical protein